MTAARVYMSFIVGLIATTYGVTEAWNMVLSIRRGQAAAGGLAVGATGVLALLFGLLVVGRIMHVTTLRRAWRRKNE